MTDETTKRPVTCQVLGCGTLLEASHGRFCDRHALNETPDPFNSDAGAAASEREKIITALRTRLEKAEEEGEADHEHARELLADLAAEVSRLSAERDALAVSLATLREAARVAGHIAVIPYTDAGNEAVRNLDDALTATASPAEHGARVIEEAEARGAAWVAAVADPYVPIRIDPAEVCRTAREPKGTR